MTFNPLSLLGSALGGIQTYLIVGAVSIAVGLASGAYAGYRWELGDLDALKLADAQAVLKATQEASASRGRQDAVDLSAAVAEAQAQTKVIIQTQTLIRKVPIYVTLAQDSRGCVTVGFLRILRGAGTEADPSTLQLAPGQSDDDCSTLTLSALAGTISALYGVSLANSEQLNALNAWVVDNHKAQVAP